MLIDWVSPDDLENSTDELAPTAASAASLILWSLTGRRYGGRHTVTELYEPDRAGCFAVRELGLLNAGILSGNAGQQPYRRGPCNELYIPLEHRPARSLLSVRSLATNELVPEGARWLVNRAYLVLSQGVASQAGIEVTYVAGANPPAGGAQAARALADELVRLFSGADDCRLKNVTSISRQGISIEVEDAHSVLDAGRTGLPEVDTFLFAVNPGRSKTPARVFSPDSYRRATKHY